MLAFSRQKMSFSFVKVTNWPLQLRELPLVPDFPSSLVWVSPSIAVRVVFWWLPWCRPWRSSKKAKRHTNHRYRCFKMVNSNQRDPYSRRSKRRRIPTEEEKNVQLEKKELASEFTFRKIGVYYWAEQWGEGWTMWTRETGELFEELLSHCTRMRLQLMTSWSYRNHLGDKSLLTPRENSTNELSEPESLDGELSIQIENV